MPARSFAASAEAWLNRVWYERAAPPVWLEPFSLIYGALVRVRHFLYAKGLRRVHRMPCPVIVVGNLTVGGTGKTPLVAWLVTRLRELGFSPGVVTRGHAGSVRAPMLVGASDDPRQVGDEPVLLARRTHVPVAVGRDRPAAARRLIESGCDVIVSDDGLQHLALARDCELVVVDGTRRFGNGWLLPAGPLREPHARLNEADAVVVNGAAPLEPGGFGMRLEAIEAVALVGGGRVPLEALAGERVHAVAGIGHPQRFFAMLRDRGLEVIEHPLADHARIDPEDIRFADDRRVLMTEKDAVKCAAAAGERHWYVPVSACFNEPESHKLLGLVTTCIAKHGRRASSA